MHLDVEDTSDGLVWVWNPNKECWELTIKGEKEEGVHENKGEES